MRKNNISFILHKPQLSENIGACARAMKNFNFNKLLLINPKPNFPNDKILATSVGAKDIVKKAKVFNSLEESLSKLIGLSQLQIIEVDDKKYKTKQQQAKKILEIIKTETKIVIFDQKGKSISSENFTKYLINQRDSGVKKLIFIIGGAFGLCRILYKESNEIFSLGKMIWPHFLVRVMVTEQIYRSASIILGNPYHKN